MKKLMIAALAVASCTAFAEDSAFADKAVYTLSFTTKYLDYNTKAYNWKDFAKKIDGRYYVNPEFPDLQLKEIKEEDGEFGYRLIKGTEGKLNGKVTGVEIILEDYPECKSLDDLYEQVLVNLEEKLDGVKVSPSDVKKTTKKIAIYDLNADGSKAVKVRDEVITTKITFKYQNLDKSKVVSKNLSGMVFVVDGTNSTSFIWDPKVKGSYQNEFAGSKPDKSGELKYVSLVDASRSEGKKFNFMPGVYAEDKNAEGGFLWDIVQHKNPAAGWGTGKVTADRDANNKYVYSSLSGYFTGLDTDGRTLSTGVGGTWKLSFDKNSTKMFRQEDESFEAILGKKKVEIVE